MCRVLAYVGPEVNLAGLLLDPEQSLLVQSTSARFQHDGPENPDGFGAGWYSGSGSAERLPLRYRSALAIGDDSDFPPLARSISANGVLASIRRATPGLPLTEAEAQPFTSGKWLFAHNGSVTGFQSGVGDKLRSMIPDRFSGVIEGGADSEVLFGVALSLLDKGLGARVALKAIIAAVRSHHGGRLNLFLHDGDTITATAAGNSLYVLDRTGDGGGVVVASEPFDPSPKWREVPDESIVSATALEVKISALATP